MGHNGSQYDYYVIHAALIARSPASLITSFQPPLRLAVAMRDEPLLLGLAWVN